jgi:rSAM/selenodomain-associated transferase 1
MQSREKNAPALIIFIKNPVPGKVKTRLAATVGDAMALRIYRALLERIRQVVQSVSVAKYLYYSDYVDQDDEWPGSDFVKKKQSAGDLGERMSRAFAEVMEKHDRAVIVGSDVPGITPDIIKEAFRNLADYDFTIGGTEDGGYYLLGMNSYEPAVFRDIEWSTSAVFPQTLDAIVTRGKSCWQLPVLSDIDFEEDWRKHGWEI